MKRLLAPVFVAGALVAACSSSTNGTGSVAFASQLCMKFAGCGITVKDCNLVFAAVVLPPGCSQSTLLNATCGDLNAKPIPASLAACFPACSGTSAKCNSDGTITICDGSTQYQYTCSGTCAVSSSMYTGTCGTSYNGQQSSDGQPKCWCQ